MSESTADGTVETIPAITERRKKERFPCAGFAEVILDDIAFLFRGRIRDLSATGCYIESSARLVLERGTQVELRFMVRNVELRLSARIMIVRAGAGAGFEFLPLDAEMRSRLASVIYKLARPEMDEEALSAMPVAETGEASLSPRNLWH